MSFRAILSDLDIIIDLIRKGKVAKPTKQDYKAKKEEFKRREMLILQQQERTMPVYKKEKQRKVRPFF